MKNLLIALLFLLPSVVTYSQEIYPCIKGGKWGFCDEAGNVIIPYQYDTTDMFHEGLAKVRLNDKYGHINQKGEIVTPIQYLWVGNFSCGMAQVIAENRREGFVDTSGKIAIPANYLLVTYFVDGYAIVTKGKKFLLIDKKNNIVLREKGNMDEFLKKAKTMREQSSEKCNL